jgi:hypothetical protein
LIDGNSIIISGDRYDRGSCHDRFTPMNRVGGSTYRDHLVAIDRVNQSGARSKLTASNGELSIGQAPSVSQLCGSGRPGRGQRVRRQNAALLRNLFL